MADQSLSLLPLYKGWDNYQDLLVKTIEPLTPEQLALRAAPQLRSVGENATHIALTRAGWLFFTLEIKDARLAPFGEWQSEDQPDRSAAELVDALQVTWQVIQDTLSAWTIADLDGIVHDTDENGADITLTRQWVLWHLLEHDIHHGGELSFTLGMFGLPAISL